jgi:hypothetical protein
VAAVGPIDHCDAALRIARSRWRAAVNAEDRLAESTAMGRLDQLLDERLSAVRHVRESLGCCARQTASSAPGGLSR